MEKAGILERTAVSEHDAAVASGTSAMTKARGRHNVSKFRLVLLGCLALLPSFLMRPCYRLFFGYRVGKRVRIGFSVIDAAQCVIEDDVQIGHLNAILGVNQLFLGDHVRIGHLNIIRGGEEVRMGRYSELIRINEINSIPDPDVVNPVDPKFLLGAGSIITTGHKIDFTDRVEIGQRSIIGGRNSSVWTHNRQRTQPVSIGSFAYVGSEIRMAPGSSIPSQCIVGIGSVVTSKIDNEGWLIAGVPAKPVKQLSASDKFLIERKTRKDLPDDL